MYTRPLVALVALVASLVSLSAGAPMGSEPQQEVATATTTVATTATPTATATAALAQHGFEMSPLSYGGAAPAYLFADPEARAQAQAQMQAQAHIAQLLSRRVSAFTHGTQRLAVHPLASGKCLRRTRTRSSRLRAPRSSRSSGSS